MAKIYYSIDTTTQGFPVYWIDASGNKHVETLDIPRADLTPGDVGKEFEIAHRGAVYLEFSKFLNRLALVEADQAKLAAWNARANA